MSKFQKGFIFIPAIWLGIAAWTGAVGYAGYNATQHPEVSQAGRK